MPRRIPAPGFTLIELLTVISIIVILGALSLPGILSVFMSGNLRANATQMSDILEEAYSAAISRNTYVWVGLFQETSPTPGVGIASVYSPHENPADFPANVNLLTKSVFLPRLNLTTVSSAQVGSADRATASVAQITDATTLGSFSARINGVPQTLNYVLEITPSGQVFISSTNKYAWIEFGLAPNTGSGKDVAVLQMNAFTGRLADYQP